MSNEMAGVTPEQVERIAAIVAREVVGKLSKELRDDIGQVRRSTINCELTLVI